jgi:SAM-dependent methyltransferase
VSRPRGVGLRLGAALAVLVVGRVPGAPAVRAAAAKPAVLDRRQQPARQPDIFFVPTMQAVAEDMLKLARVTADDVVYDLGSGDGRILIIAAEKYRARGVGIEIDPKLVALARQIAKDGEVADKVQFIEGDLFEADISPATVVTIYLSPTVNRRLEPKLRRELRPGTRIVSHQFGIGDWKPDLVVQSPDDRTDLYLFTVPGR